MTDERTARELTTMLKSGAIDNLVAAALADTFEDLACDMGRFLSQPSSQLTNAAHLEFQHNLKIARHIVGTLEYFQDADQSSRTAELDGIEEDYKGTTI